MSLIGSMKFNCAFSGSCNGVCGSRGVRTEHDIKQFVVAHPFDVDTRLAVSVTRLVLARGPMCSDGRRE